MANLSELQISLIAIGIVVVLGVVFFNWMQQRHYRRGAEKAFGSKHEDVLLRTGVSDGEDERIEPQLGKEPLHESFDEPDAESAGITELAQPTPGSAQPAPESAQPTPEPAPVKPEGETVKTERSPVRPEASHVKPEPRFRPAMHITPLGPGPAPAGRRIVDSVAAADAVDYVVGIDGGTSITDSNLSELLQRKFDFGKPVRWLGQQEAEASWEEITAESSSKGSYINLRGHLQLADRNGPVSEVSLSAFRDMAENFAAQVKAAANCPDIPQAYAQALFLDEFCTQVDVMVGINIISKDNSVFTGAKIHVLAETSGFKPGADGLFHYRDENNATLFSFGNYEASPFLPNKMRTLITHGITFLLDVPRVANGEIVFGQMMYLAENFTDALGGVMVDDNRAPLSDSGIRKIRQQLSAIQSMMLARGIPAGGETALRLFA
ncbi:ZipA, C-terminal FtsZ-binding domain [Nitrosospira briensis]|uniref:Cell division protein ZipA n=1 Tax=Nitrosospira briensis TaxID=35799 RepID=A0A1I5A6A6_9PROT|nr:cell division protein ZipA C-terminal FtsZ-binding domain-containing protein [Nitrosospira briensis]SFN57987.1 ZipA, C-terminal FtsZ-binding domain [Nitrosospira briensis]